MLPSGNDHFHALIERSAEGISVFDGNANILYESPSNKRIHGYDAEEMNGRNLFEFCHPDDQARVMPVVQKIAEKPGNSNTDIVRFRHKKGHYIYLEGTVLNAMDDPRIRGMVNNFRDVTARLEAERELKQAKEAAEQAHRLQKHFLANLSHEFKTPLTLIKQPLSDLLALPSGSPDAELLQDLIQRNLERLENLIMELIQLSMIDSGEFSLRAKRSDFLHFLRQQVSLYRHSAEQKGIELSCTAEGECMAYFDAHKMTSVVGNLLSNALKFTAAEGVVRISAELQPFNGTVEGALRVCVQDSGRGMSPETAGRVFERFFQGQAGDNREYEGMGIGLSIAREMIVQHGGSIEVESEPGRGSAFRFVLPLGVDHLNPEDIDTSETPEPTPGFLVPASYVPLAQRSGNDSEQGVARGPLLLLVEDNRDICAYLCLHLESRYRVVVARNGEEALSWLGQNRADLILSDVMMPGMDGVSLCRTIKARSDLADIPVLLLSAKGNVGQRIDGLAAGADDYLPKPFAMDELELRLSRLLRRSGGMRQFSSSEENLRERVHQIIEGQMSSNGFGVNELAQALGYSERQLQRVVFDLEGVNPSALIRRQRLARAKSLLEAGSCQTLDEVAAAVGFTTAYFAQVYRTHYGKAAVLLLETFRK